MPNNRTNLNYIRKRITRPARYEQLAEECSELAQAALKMARILRGENKTPVSVQEAKQNLVEECSDVMLCLEVLGLYSDSNIVSEKLERWVNRNPKEE